MLCLDQNLNPGVNALDVNCQVQYIFNHYQETRQKRLLLAEILLCFCVSSSSPLLSLLSGWLSGPLLPQMLAGRMRLHVCQRSGWATATSATCHSCRYSGRWRCRHQASTIQTTTVMWTQGTLKKPLVKMFAANVGRVRMQICLVELAIVHAETNRSIHLPHLGICTFSDFLSLIIHTLSTPICLVIW